MQAKGGPKRGGMIAALLGSQVLGYLRIKLPAIWPGNLFKISESE
jgi:hypothetical protein